MFIHIDYSRFPIKKLFFTSIQLAILTLAVLINEEDFTWWNGSGGPPSPLPFTELEKWKGIWPNGTSRNGLNIKTLSEANVEETWAILLQSSSQLSHNGPLRTSHRVIFINFLQRMRKPCANAVIQWIACCHNRNSLISKHSEWWVAASCFCSPVPCPFRTTITIPTQM